MSFYGNSYYYTAETFARIVLQNLGINNFKFTPPEGSTYTMHDTNDNVLLNAGSREDGIKIASGNHWITLAYVTNPPGFQILHNAPRVNVNEMPTFTKLEESDGVSMAGIKENCTILDFEDTIKVPSISYDEAGHVSATDKVSYYQMPKNPVEEVTTRMDAIDGINFKEGEIDTSLRRKLLDRMKTIDGKDDDGTVIPNFNSLNSKFQAEIDNMRDWEKRISQAESKAVDALETATDTANDFATIRQTVVGSAVSIEQIQKDIAEIKKEINMT